MWPWTARTARLGHRRRRGSPDAPDGPPALTGLNLCLRPAATGFTVLVSSRVSDASLTEAAAAVLGAMRGVESNDASRLLFGIAAALGEVVIARDCAWLELCCDALAAEAAGEVE